MASGQRNDGTSNRLMPIVSTIEHTVIMMLALVSAIADMALCVCCTVRRA